MRCGAKCFLIEMDVHGENQTKSVNARTPAEARKAIRRKHGEKVGILSVRQKTRR